MKSIRSKLMLGMIAIAFVITAIFSVVTVYFINVNTKDALIETIQPFTESAAKNINDIVDVCVNQCASVTNSSDFNDAETQGDKYSVLKQAIADENAVFVCIFNDQVEFCAGDRSLNNICDADDISKAARAEQGVVSDISNGYFTVLTPAQNGLISAVCFSTDIFNSCVSSISFGDSGEIYAVNSSGTIIIDKNNKKASAEFSFIEEAENDDVYSELADSTKSAVDDIATGSSEYRYNDESYISGYTKLDYFDATLISTTLVSSFSGANAKVFYRLIIIGVALIVLTAITSILFAKNFSRPIVTTTKRLRQLAQGNLTDPVDVWYSKDELGILSNSLEETIVSLRQYISLITAALTQISDGNLCHRMEGTFKGDFIKIKSTFNQILESLSDTFATINTAAEQVNTGAVQVSNSAQVLSQGSTRQASSIEELSATIAGVSKQVQQNSNDAKNAYDIVTENVSAIDNCNSDMSNMLDAMDQIKTASNEIAKIIKVIDEISFQTNILALNAAVEAAREGSKGFGVVADEVRRLASRSAEAAKQTASLIENSTTAVDKGSFIAKETADSLNEIVDSSATIKSLVKNITDASAQQANAIVQINTGVDQISAVVANNTANAVGSASASEELSGQSLMLKNMIARFKLTDSVDSEGATSRYSYVSDEPAKKSAVNILKKSAFVYPDDEDFIDKIAEESDNVDIKLDDEDNDKY